MEETKTVKMYVNILIADFISYSKLNSKHKKAYEK